MVAVFLRLKLRLLRNSLRGGGARVALTIVAVPIALLLAFLPAGWGLRLACAGGGLALAMFYSSAYMPEAVENRVVKAGYPVGTATRVRDRAGLVRQQAESDRKRAAAAKRAARYRERLGR